MIATLEYVNEAFDRFNKLCFEGSLSKPPISLSRSRKALGMVRYHKNKMPDGRFHYYDMQMLISDMRDVEESVLEDTILHEMIHYWIMSNQMQDSSVHGKIFRAKMNQINKDFGRNITIKHRLTEEEQNSDTEVRIHIFCVIKFTDGRTGIIVVAKTRLFWFWDRIRVYGIVRDFKWMASYDPYFNRFPRTRTLKMIIVDEDELKQHLQYAKELVREGNVIKEKYPRY